VEQIRRVIPSSALRSEALVALHPKHTKVEIYPSPMIIMGVRQVALKVMISLQIPISLPTET
jgi:hypothetical protein